MFQNMILMLGKAKEEGYAVPQFNINNLEWTKYILEMCEQHKSPVILGVSEGAVKYMGGYNTVSMLVKGLMKDLKITIPVVLHLDHGSSVESCKQAIDAGFSSVMIDASKYELDKNIAITKEVVEYAHVNDVSVEAEIGHIGGQEDNEKNDIVYARVDESEKLFKETKMDFLAPALGSVHGLYKSEPNINFVRMQEIKETLNIPLVLHGGTGLSDEIIKKSIKCGICKININTELQIAWSIGVREKIANDNKVYDPRKIIGAGENNIKSVVLDKINLLGSINRG